MRHVSFLSDDGERTPRDSVCEDAGRRKRWSPVTVPKGLLKSPGSAVTPNQHEIATGPRLAEWSLA